MTRPLPVWAQTTEAQALLAAIRLERPDCWYLKRYADDYCRYPRYKGLAARHFRELWEAEREAAMDANDRERWIELGQFQADDLIEQVLAVSDVLGEQVERELRFTIELQRKVA